MIIIGEKINGAIPRVAQAIQNRDSEAIIALVKAQEENGADYLDVCAGTAPEEEYDALCWLLDTVQSVATKPICIDSPAPEMIVSVLPRIQKPGIINSVSGEGKKCEILIPVLQNNPEWQVIVLACDNNGIASTADDKVRIAGDVIRQVTAAGVAPERIHVDPLVLALSAVPTAALSFMEASRRIKAENPGVKITAALSNVSYGMPARGLVNRNFLTLAMYAGLDSLIGNPLNQALRETILATEALLDKDRRCRNYNKAYRAGLIGAAATRK